MDSPGDIAGPRLRSFVERIERIFEEEIKALTDDKKDIYAEAKGEGSTSKSCVRWCGFGSRIRRSGTSGFLTGPLPARPRKGRPSGEGRLIVTRRKKGSAGLSGVSLVSAGSGTSQVTAAPFSWELGFGAFCQRPEFLRVQGWGRGTLTSGWPDRCPTQFAGVSWLK